MLIFGRDLSTTRHGPGALVDVSRSLAC